VGKIICNYYSFLSFKEDILPITGESLIKGRMMDMRQVIGKNGMRKEARWKH
jgi:hypothetical protein